MFIPVFYVLCFICLILFLFANSFLKWFSSSNENQSDASTSTAFRSFQRTYLLVYLSATAGDWLQGPHIYALYESYGMSKHEIELLFITGYGSSMVFGTFVGSFADKYGRRRNCFLYGLLYGTACVTKHFANFWILLFGRLLSGISTSILYSAFESWALREHAARSFGEGSLSLLFGFATLGNSLVAIGAGIVAQFAADRFGYVAPFDVALGVLLFMSVVMVYTWSENYGDAKGTFGDSFKEAWRCLRDDRRVLFLGLVQSLFEGAMYTFVLEWTPALSRAAASYFRDSAADAIVASPSTDSAKEPTTVSAVDRRFTASIPHGYVFATFMVAIMIGSSVFRVLCKYVAPASFMRYVLITALLSLLPPVVCPTNLPVVFFGFIVFEGCVGVFWPSMSYMRGIYVPEGARSTLMSFFRVPLNLIVVTILSNDLPLKWIFQSCVSFLGVACILQHILSGSSASSALSIRVIPKPLPVLAGKLTVSRKALMEEAESGFGH